MRTTTLPLVVAALLGLETAPAQAQLARTFISAGGSDANSCARTAPCRTLAGAFAKTNAGGEINMLDPAGYGTVFINKSISIVNDGVGSAGILVPSSADGITIFAGPGDVINLRGLIIEGAGVGQHGIKFQAGKSLTIENCVIRNLAGYGIEAIPNASSKLSISNTLVSDNAIGGIHVAPTGSGAVTIVLNHVELYNIGPTAFGLDGTGTTGTIDATVKSSIAAGSGNTGFIAASSTGHAVTKLTLARSVSAYNFFGVYANGTNAIVRIAESTVTGNASGWQAAGGGVLQSYGNNHVDGNAADEGAMPIIAKK